jgi:hypothetical protein
MARKFKHTEDEVLKSLSKKHDVKINRITKEIYILNGKSSKPQFQKSDDLGNSSWGKIDYLTKHCGYRRMFTAEF